jgi:Na+:H+ antiporter, NhaA family
VFRVRHRRRSFIRPLIAFLSAEATGGIAVAFAAIVALIWANSPWASSYESLWRTTIGVSTGPLPFSINLRQCLNDGLMTIFFFVVGLEIKRELVDGELKDRRKAFTPLVAAVGGMVLPALIFLAFTVGTPDARGWGIPMATDIALAVGLLTLAGDRVPPGAKLFLLALAIVDDLGAIAVIAIFYRHGGRIGLLAFGALVVLVVLGLQRLRVRAFSVYLALGLVLWWVLREAGVHPTMAGVAMGLLTPVVLPLVTERPIPTTETSETTETTEPTEEESPGEWLLVESLEHRLHPVTSLLIVPLFALANAGIAVSGSALQEAMSSRLTWGIVLGLVLGKPAGILLATWVAVRSGLGALPDGTDWRSLAPAAVLAGVGFTVSLFVTELAFAGPSVSGAKIGVLIASVAAGVAGLVFARRLPPV